MTTRLNALTGGPSFDDSNALPEVLGYLNFSSGKPDPVFRRRMNHLCTHKKRLSTWTEVETLLCGELESLAQSSSVFSDSHQARAVLSIVFHDAWQAYRQFHADLLFHLTDEQLQQPFFLCRLMETVLAQGPPWDERERIVRGAVDQLNDFVGYRPMPVFEDGRNIDGEIHSNFSAIPPHERFCPVPLFFRGVGAAAGPYHDLVTRAIEFMCETPEEILRAAYFDLDRLDELVLDVRAHDHLHPVNKRANYMFGEWDPHSIDNSGQYRRFVVRSIIIDSLAQWVEEASGIPRKEALYDASAVLCGTMLMASAISGSSPQTHSSEVTLMSLLPAVARQRDRFYQRLLEEAEGPRAKRLKREAERHQQPFGHVRQHLNLKLARYGAQQLQRRTLADLFARMGFTEASRRQAEVIPSTSARFECEIQCCLTSANRHLDTGELAPAVEFVTSAEAFVHRGIRCGALVDPWNILGFQGQFPVFAAREDVVFDQRVDVLLDLMHDLFETYSRALGEAAAQGDRESTRSLTQRLENLAEFWDRFATTTVDEFPQISGREVFESAVHVAEALAEWHAAGKAGGDISFWKRHVSRFQSSRSYALVARALLQKRDSVAAMALLMQWLSQADEVGLETSTPAVHELLIEWMDQVINAGRAGDGRSQDFVPMIRRLFDYLEVNSGEYWNVPKLGEFGGALGKLQTPPDDQSDLFDSDDDDEERELFSAAYEHVVFRDSAADGQMGDVHDGGYAARDTEFELLARQLEPRLRFLMTVAHLWQTAASALATRAGSARDETDQDLVDCVLGWKQRTAHLQRELLTLLDDVYRTEVAASSGDHESNIEYDIQLQTKFNLLYMIVAAHVGCVIAERALSCCLPSEHRRTTSPEPHETVMLEVYRHILKRDFAAVRQVLPGLCMCLSSQPLLYVPIEKGGNPHDILKARVLQADMRFLLSELPKLGLFRETWQVLLTAHNMEQTGRPRGLAVTEFDRLFRTALKNSLECLLKSSETWSRTASFQTQLVRVIGDLVEHYRDQWIRHSRTMRLSSVEGIGQEVSWKDVKWFISHYGEEFFSAHMLTLSNVRAILHNGIDAFLDYLDENEDPLHPLALLEDLRQGKVDRDRVIAILEVTYETVVDKFDRFIEYNSTTTQSDYGNLFYCLIDFLRVEAAYDLDAWKFVPISLAHETLARWGEDASLKIWEDDFVNKSSELADRHLQALERLEKSYGIHLPAISDRLHERFVKPLAVNRMRALIPRSIEEGRRDPEQAPSFEALMRDIEEYLAGTSGSGVDIPDWLQSLEKEADRTLEPTSRLSVDGTLKVLAPSLPISYRELRAQLREWNQSIPRTSHKGKGRGKK